MAEDDQTESETKAPRSRGTRPTDRTMTATTTAAPAATPARGFGSQNMPWNRGGGGWGQQQPPAAPNGNTGVVGPGQGQPLQAGGHPGFGWGGGGGWQPGGIMGGQGQGQMPNWQALAQQFQQRFANSPIAQRLGLTGMQGQPPGQAPAAPPADGQGQPMPQRTPPFYAGPQAAQGQQPGMQGGPLQAQIGRLAQLFGRQQPGGIVGPGQGPQGG